MNIQKPKLVNIQTTRPIYITQPPIDGNVFRVELKTGDIKYCLMQGARVQEVLSDGSTIKLDMSNFNKVHTVDKPIVQPKIEEALSKPVDTITEPTNVKVDLDEVSKEVDVPTDVEDGKQVIEEGIAEEVKDENTEEQKQSSDKHKSTSKNVNKYNSTPKKNY